MIHRYLSLWFMLAISAILDHWPRLASHISALRGTDLMKQPFYPLQLGPYRGNCTLPPSIGSPSLFHWHSVKLERYISVISSRPSAVRQPLHQHSNHHIIMASSDDESELSQLPTTISISFSRAARSVASPKSVEYTQRGNSNRSGPTENLRANVETMGAVEEAVDAVDTWRLRRPRRHEPWRPR